MREKFLIQVLLPATGKRYEFWVPFDMTIEESADLIGNILAYKESEVFTYTGGADFMLLPSYGVEAGGLLNPQETWRIVSELDSLTNGCPVMLI